MYTWLDMGLLEYIHILHMEMGLLVLNVYMAALPTWGGGV